MDVLDLMALYAPQVRLEDILDSKPSFILDADIPRVRNSFGTV
jgi:hypothetical protein